MRAAAVALVAVTALAGVPGTGTAGVGAAGHQAALGGTPPGGEPAVPARPPPTTTTPPNTTTATAEESVVLVADTNRTTLDVSYVEPASGGGRFVPAIERIHVVLFGWFVAVVAGLSLVVVGTLRRRGHIETPPRTQRRALLAATLVGLGLGTAPFPGTRGPGLVSLALGGVYLYLRGWKWALSGEG